MDVDFIRVGWPRALVRQLPCLILRREWLLSNSASLEFGISLILPFCIVFRTILALCERNREKLECLQSVE